MARELKGNHCQANVNINDALSCSDGALVYLYAEKITSQAMITLIELLETWYSTASKIKIVLDDAR